MTDLTQVQLIKTQTLARIVEITSEMKPSYNIDGQSVQWGVYHRYLTDMVKWCDDQINAQSPFEIQTQAYT